MNPLKNFLVAIVIVAFPVWGWTQVIPCGVTLNASLGGTPPVPQTYNMTNGNISTCSGVFYDPGGTSNYGNSIGLTTMTFCSDQPGEQIILDFTAYGFQVETNYDFLNIYDGTGTGGTQLWNSQTQGGATNPGIVTSTTGCLTVTFSSDGSVTYEGWGADISCTNAVSGSFDCNGGDVLLTANGQGQQTTVMSNDFNTGLGSGWVATGGSAVGAPCGPSLDGTDYYWASTASGTPNLTTIPYDVSCGGSLSFDMAYATQGGSAPCEGPDLPDEGVTLQYSTDGGATWTVIQYWSPNGGYDPNLTSWNNYMIPIPPGAQGTNTQFQWIQDNSSGTCCDNWGIDNVMITANTNCAAYWYDYNHIPGYPDANTDVVNITSTTTFGVWYTNGIDSCYATTTIIVPPGTTADAGADQTICSTGTVTIGGAPTTPDNGATYTWSTGATGTIGAGDNGQITVSPLVTTDYYLTVEYNGCMAYDTVTVFMDAPPTASNPASINVECAADLPVPDPSVVTDENDDVTVPPTVTFLNDVSDGLSCPETITRTYRVEDACGNYIDVQQTITIHDIQSPVFVAPPATLNVQCAADIPAMTDLVWTDNCDGTGTVAGTDVSDGQSCPETITRTWTHTDACGNTATETQIITVHDTQAPAFATPPATLNVQCVTDIPAMTDLGWTDNCDGTGTVAGTDVSDGLSCPETITRTWTYTDICGNTATETQIITVHDTQVPVFAAPPTTLTVECVSDIPAMASLGWTDNCDGSGVVVGTDVSDGLSCPETITRTWTHTDACGNTATETQIIIVEDTTPPTASNPAALVIAGGTPIPPADPLIVNDEADNCTSAPTVTWVSDVSDNGNCPEIITRTYCVTDDCGNQTFVTQQISIGDAILPSASNPTPINVQCSGDVPAPDPLVVTDESDNGVMPPVVTFESEVSDGLSCPETITRTYRVTDDCGNFIFVTQTITIHDVQAPVFSTPPANTTVECSADVPAITSLGWTDNCDGMGYIMGSDVSDGLSCPETITRTWTYTDACGNTATETQIITVFDTQAPVFNTPPADLTVECSGDVPTMLDLGWTDNCDGVGTISGVDVSDGLSCPETITRTWTYTDACGNMATETQTITVHDVTPPTAYSPTPISVPGPGDVPAPDPAVITSEADNCTANPVVAFVSEVSDGNVCNNELITQTYSVTDDCGNQTLVTFEITILAAPPPIDAGNDTMVCLGQDVIIVPTNPTNAQLNWVPSVPQGIFAPTSTTTYTVTADNNGCVATDQITITVEEPPQVSFIGDVLSGCAPHTVTFTNTSSSISGMADCIWTINGEQFSSCGTEVFTFDTPGTYDVTLTTTSLVGCVASETYAQYVYVEGDPLVQFIPSQTVLSSMYTEVVFDNNTQGATTYDWQFGDGESSIDENPSHAFPQEPGAYNVVLTATSDFGCVGEAFATITVNEELIYYIPNTFTPDNDDFNETFLPIFSEGYDPFDYHLMIFNRWGEIIWESYDASVGWDGTYGLGGNPVQDGAYTWRIEFKINMNDERMLIDGHVNLIR